jgi:hypothetical protein
VRHVPKSLKLGVTMLLLLVVMPPSANAQMNKVKTVWVILMENHNWTGNNTGAAFGAPDISAVHQRDPGTNIGARGAVFQSS